MNLKYAAHLDELEVQFKHVVTKPNVLELKRDDDTINLYRVFVELGARWVRPVGEDDSSNEPKVMAHIEGVMVKVDPGFQTVV